MQNKLEYEVPTYHNWSQVARFYHPLQAGSIDGTDTYPHDKGIWRALLAKYKPNKRVEGNPNCTLFVGRLNRETKEATLIKCFSKYGNIKSCRLVRDVVTGLSRGYAFIEYEHERDAKIAYREMYKTDIDGHEILVDYELERTLKGWIPRRLGGGLGGKKESGQLRFGGRDRPFRRPLPVKVLRQGHAGGSDHDKDYDRNRNRPSTCNRDSRDYQRDTRENREYHRDSRDYNRDTRESRDNHRDTRDSRDYHRDSRNYSRHSRDYNRDSRDSRDDSRDSRDRSGTRSFEREKDSYRDERPHEAGDGKDYDVDQKRRSDSSRDRRGSKHDWDRNEKDRRKEGRDQSHYDSYRKKGESSRKERK